MGLVKTDQIRNAAGTGNVDLFKQWAAKGMVTIDGSGTISVRQSKNVSSITDYGTGSYGATLTAAMSTNDYLAHGSAITGSGTFPGISSANRIPLASPATASEVRFLLTNAGTGSADIDPYYIGASILGELA